MVENKNEITINEFKAWLVGLIRGKNGDLPNLDDWKQIKTMLDKVQEETVYVEKEVMPWSPYTPSYPYQPSPPYPYTPIMWGDLTWKQSGEYSVMNTDNTNAIMSGSVLDPTSIDEIFSDWT